ncbi:hypothetical protein AMTRI_Chr06g195240 [Amborella trichopoda]
MLEFSKKYGGRMVFKCHNTRCFVYISFSKKKRLMHCWADGGLDGPPSLSIVLNWKHFNEAVHCLIAHRGCCGIQQQTMKLYRG